MGGIFALLIISQWFLTLGITPSDVWFSSTTHSTIQRIGGIPLFKIMRHVGNRKIKTDGNFSLEKYIK